MNRYHDIDIQAHHRLDICVYGKPSDQAVA
jgi:hypothetical protein